MGIGRWVVLAAVASACSGGKLTSGDAAQETAHPPGPATTTFNLLIPSGESYCHQSPGCPSGYENLRIGTAAGARFTLPTRSDCWADCTDACVYSCNAVECIPNGVAVSGTLQWDGRYDETSPCGSDCMIRRYAPPGQYTAQLCATPGTLPPGGPGDGGLPSAPTCTNTGAEICGPVVPFTFPSSTPIDLPIH